MFIPKGKAIHENLATSYVLVDALVADLCEGGFTGVVEVVLRDTDSHVIISRGAVMATIETRPSDDAESGETSHHRPAVVELASRAKLERGRVSVYSYSLAISRTVAGRIHSQPLYTRLSSEFADLERMLSKLGREPDRQWFVEIDSESGLSGLIHLNGERCVVMTSEGGRSEAEINRVDLMQNAELRSLVDGFSQAGGTFDVYYRGVEDSAGNSQVSPSEHPDIESQDLAREIPDSHEPSTLNRVDADSESNDEVARAVMAAKAAFQSLSVEESNLSLYGEEDDEPKAPPDPVPPSPAELEEARFSVLGMAREPEPEEGPGGASKQSSAEETQEPLLDSAEASDDDEVHRAEDDLLLVRDDFKAAADLQRASEDEVLAEVKRLMAEIARTIEDAIESVEHRSTFPIHLRAGQLKVADRFPFLDPFGPEFEYLAGEIAFVGHVRPAEFVEGLTQALKLAVDGVAQASAHSSRVRGQVSEALRWLLSRQQTEFEAYGLDESIRDILNA